MAGRISDITRMTEAGVDVVFNRTVQALTQKRYPLICTEKNLKRRIGSYNTIGDFTAAAIKDEGDTIPYDKVQHYLETTITSYTVAKGAEASLEQIHYDLENVVLPRFGMPLVKPLLQYKEKLIAELYNDAFTTTGADGKYLIDDDHPLQSSVLVNNNLATGALGLDAFIAAKQKFNYIYDQAGEFYDTEPTHLLIHPDQIYKAKQIIESILVPFELVNTKNVANDVMPIRIITNKYIDATKWFLLDRSLQDCGAILQTSKGLMLETWWEKNNSVFRGMAKEMYGAGIVSPGYGIVGSTGI